MITASERTVDIDIDIDIDISAASEMIVYIDIFRSMASTAELQRLKHASAWRF